MVVTALDSEEARAGDFTLAPRAQVIPTWTRRGLVEEMGSYSGSSSDQSTPDILMISMFFRVGRLRDEMCSR